MTDNDDRNQAIDVLQQLGLKEYEAKCFVGLSRLSDSRGTAKELSEITEVPRTRVYDAIRVLEAQGLVEIQHSSPQQFRAVPLSEATDTLRDQYEARVDRLAGAIERMEEVESDESEPVQEVWGMSGTLGIANRTQQLIAESTDEVVLVIGEDSILTDELVEQLNDLGREIDLLVATVSVHLESEVQERVPRAQTFMSGLQWLRSEEEATDGLAVGRLLLVDRSSILVSSYEPTTGDERAVFGTGFKNGLVTLARRVMAQGMLTAEDPAEL